MGHDQITAHKEYLQTLNAIGQSTFGRSNAAIANVLTIDQLNAKIQRLSDDEKKQVEYVGNIFIGDAEQSYEKLEKILKEKYETSSLDSNLNLQLAIQAYEKLALNHKIGIKDTIMKFNGDSGIQRTLINASDSLEKVHEFIVRIERVIGEDSKEVSGDSAAILRAEKAEKLIPKPQATS